jgi:hypothetical protein
MSGPTEITKILSAQANFPSNGSVASTVLDDMQNTEGDSHRKALSQAKSLVADYLRDLGLRDPDLIAKESQRIVEMALAGVLGTKDLDREMLNETAIRITVNELESFLGCMASHTNCAETPDRLGCVMAARLPMLLREYPQELQPHALPAEWVESLQQGLAPVIPTPRPSRMKRQALALVPSFALRIYARFRKVEIGETKRRQSEASS